jgi:transcriptional regulator with XRE-family HTH domain
VAKTLRETREERGGIGIRRLSRGAPVAPRTIYSIERGESTPSVETIRKISRFLGVDAMEITEFRDALEARGYSELPEEEPAGADLREEDARYANIPDPERSRSEWLQRLVEDMSALDRDDVDVIYRLVFRDEPPR